MTNIGVTASARVRRHGRSRDFAENAHKRSPQLRATMDLNYLVMVLFLILGTCANLPFFVRSIRDTFCSSAKFSKTPAAPSALLTTSLAELMWVLPCFVQVPYDLPYDLRARGRRVPE